MVEAAKNILKEETPGGHIEIQGVSRIFKDSNSSEVVALNDASLEINEGEFVSLVGPSGCGKSTLLRLIAGLDTPTKGTLKLDNKVIEGPNYLRGLVFQDPTLFPWLSVKNNVASGLVARKIYDKKNNEVMDYIKLVGLDGFEDSYPHQLSGGMAQRVALARVLVNHPKVLLLDEPLGALDAFTRMYMQDEIIRIWKERKTTVVLVTHDIDEAVYMSERIIVMTPRPGKIQEIINVPLGWPRRRNDPDFFRIRSKILEILNFVKEESLNYYL